MDFKNLKGKKIKEVFTKMQSVDILNSKDKIEEFLEEKINYVKTEITSFNDRIYKIVLINDITCVFDINDNFLIGTQVYEGENFEIINDGKIIFIPGHDDCQFIFLNSLKIERVYIR